MNTDLLTLNNMLVGTISTSDPSSHVTTRKTSYSSLVREEKSSQVNTYETSRTENSSDEARKDSINKPQEDFNQTLRAKTTPESQDSTKSETQRENPQKAEQANIVQTWISEYSESVDKSKEGDAAKIKAKAGRQLAELLASFKAHKSSPITGQAAKSAEIKLLITTDKKQLGLKTVLPDTAKGPNVANTQLAESKQADKINLLNKTTAGTKAQTKNGITPALIKSEALTNNGSKTTSVEKRQAIADISTANNSLKASLLSEKNAMSDTLSDGKSKTSSSSEKISTINTNLLTAQLKNHQSSSQTATINPEKLILAAEKQINNKDTLNQNIPESLKGKTQGSLQAENNISTASNIRKLDATITQISAGQTKSRDNSTSNNGTNSTHKQIFSQNNLQTPITTQSDNFSDNLKTTNLKAPTSPNEVSADIGKQLLESIHKSFSQQRESQQITVRLNPPELGRVLIKFQERDAQLNGLLEVSKAQTRLEIEQALPQIIRNLAESGIQIKRLEVVLSNEAQSEQGAIKDQSLQNGNAQQQGSTNPGSPENNPDTSQANELLTNNKDYQNIFEPQEALITDGSINLLI